jgi:hypothetical protein
MTFERLDAEFKVAGIDALPQMAFDALAGGHCNTICMKQYVAIFESFE